MTGKRKSVSVLAKTRKRKNYDINRKTEKSDEIGFITPNTKRRDSEDSIEETYRPNVDSAYFTGGTSRSSKFNRS